MSASDIISFVVLNVKRMRLRIALTVLGVTVGTMAIVAMVALGIGAQESASAQLMSLQSVNDLTVIPGDPTQESPFSSSGKKVRLDDKLIKKISRFEGVKAVTPGISISDVTAKTHYGKGKSVQIASLDKGTSLKLVSGRTPRSNSEKAIVVSAKFGESLGKAGRGTAREMVGKPITLLVARTMEDGSVEERLARMRVTGVAKEKGGQEDYGTVYMPVGVLRDLWEWQVGSATVKRDGYATLTVVAESPEKVDSVAAKLKDLGVFVFSLKEVLAGLNGFFKAIQAILGTIGAITLLVAALGITNTMIMSIYERTREIGIMKAIGASSRDVILLFLGEAAAIGLAGGVLGTVLGWLASKGLGAIGSSYVAGSGGGSEASFSPVVPWTLAAFAILFATVVGILAGAYPAIRASRLNPLVALRHE